MAFQPPIEEPSNMTPSANISSIDAGNVHRDMLQFALGVGKAQIDELDVVFFDSA